MEELIQGMILDQKKNRRIKTFTRPLHICIGTWLKALECVTDTAKNKPLKPVQVNKIGLWQEQVTSKGCGWAGFFEVARNIPLIPLSYLFE